jgi:diguanylate cyclase (GGDEF)-like protein
MTSQQASTHPIADSRSVLDAEVEALRSELVAGRIELSVLRAQIDEARQALLQGGPSDLAVVNDHLVSSALQAARAAEESHLALLDSTLAAPLDELTQLPNRVLLLGRLAHAIADAQRQGHQLAVLFIDLNNFKQINDEFGAAVGDEMLRIAAQRLKDAVRPYDIVSRHGSDEFLVLLTQLQQPAEALAIANQLIATLCLACTVEPHRFVLSASIGISLFPDDGEDAGRLIARADLAMYRAKRSGSGICVAGSAEVGPQSLLQASRYVQRRPAPGVGASPDGNSEHVNLRLREANEQLLLAALSSQELASAAENARRQQREHFAIVAHELRSPLSPIRMAAGLLDRVPAHELPQMQAIIEREVVHMTRLVGDLLDLSRVHTGKLRLERRSLDLGKIIEESIDVCRPAMEARQQVFSSLRTEVQLTMYGDPTRLAQVFRNLLDNASKYTADGGEISLEVAVLGNTVEVTVSDSGIGIAPEALPMVFEPFAQDPHAVGFNGFGLGIGLTVVRELVEGHNGTVLATSAGTGQGSRFVVTLPLSGGGAALW